MRRVRIYVLFHEGAFRDVYASYSAASRDKHDGPCCRIETFDREDYQVEFLSFLSGGFVLGYFVRSWLVGRGER